MPFTNEHIAARKYSKVVAEWDGTPFRVDIIKNFPTFVMEDDLRELLAPIGTLAEAIEKQIGYRVVEMGGTIDVPNGAADRWNEDFEYYWQNDSESQLLPRQPSQILVFYMDDDNPRRWDGLGGAPNSAHICCGTISYNRRTMGCWWHEKDPCCVGDYAANGRYGHVIVHELFHILGFRHPDDEPPERGGVPMRQGHLYRPWTIGKSRHSASQVDIEVLRRIFPKK